MVFLKPSVMRVAWPTLFVSVVLLGLCVAMAVLLYLQQSYSAQEVGENVDSRRVAQELETTLGDLAALVKKGNPGDPLHDKVRDLLDRAEELADKPDEKVHVQRVEASFERYLHPEPGSPLAAEVLEKEALPATRELREYNSRQIEDSERAHRDTVRGLAVGLIVLAAVASATGLVFGYGMSRSLRRSIHQLQVHLRDASGKLRRDLPRITITDTGDLAELQQQMRVMVGEIETVVGRLQQREREVLRAEQLAAVGQLAAGAAHELRNPLTAVKMLVQTNREEALDRGLPVEDLDVIEQEIRRMERCLQTFLDFARPPRPARRRIDLGALVKNTLAIVEARARKQKVALETDLSGAAVEVEVDAGQVQQVLVNLLLNALDAMPSGGRVEVTVSATGNGSVAVGVRDTGPGVAPSMAPRLFEPFVSTKETGLGLGLVVSRRIAEDHGGTLTAEAPAGSGACFVLTLPAARAPESVPGEHAAIARH